ncbi:MAG: ABC transporter permease [Acidobacteriaceae bacterium]|nr:ABC transporter permease [Acidobacteriaceae bacterium]
MTSAAQLQTTAILIEPQRRLEFRLQEVWAYRDLIYFLVWRDIKVRYKQTALGTLWAILQPVLTTLVFSLFFGRLAKVPSDGFPYPVFAYVGLLPWQLFAYSLTESANSLVSNQNLIRKVYFPRLVIPLSAVLAGLVDFAIAFVVLLVMLFIYGIRPGVSIVLLPVFLLLAVVTALTVGLWFSALNVQYRDVRYIIPFLTQLWLLATPVAYPATLIPEHWRPWYGLNPMAGVVEGFRWALLGRAGNPGALIAVSVAVVLVMFVGGLIYFRRMESTFADVV